jgi:hypothetical protein
VTAPPERRRGGADGAAMRRPRRAVNGVRWRADLGVAPPVVGDRLFRPLPEGVDDPGPGWTLLSGRTVDGERMATKIATVDDHAVTGVWIVPPRDLTAGTAVEAVLGDHPG